MFTNLIESDSHRRELKRRSSFFLATVAAYAVILFVAGIVSIYAYDARLEAQTSSLELLNWVPPVERAADPPRVQPTRGLRSSTDRVSSQPTRPILYESPDNPIKPPEKISGEPNPIPPAPLNAIERPYVSDPPGTPNTNGCVTCAGTETRPPVVVKNDTAPPAASPVKPQTQRLPTQILVSKAINLPQPTYPAIAKQIRAQGTVLVQILVGENGHVLTAQPVSGHPTLLAAAREAALRARFTPTILNGVPVKVQGVITYNFVLQ